MIGDGMIGDGMTGDRMIGDRMTRCALVFLLVATACRGSAAPSPIAEAAELAPAAKTALECPPRPSPIVVPCTEPEAGAVDDAITGDDKLTLVRTRFDKLPGWTEDSHSEAVPALLASCEKLAELDDNARVGTGPYGGRAKHWRRACAGARALEPGDDAAALEFFEKELRPYEAHGTTGPEGKMTGYYVQPLNASRTRSERYRFPLLARPPDLVEVQLSDFIGDGRSRRIWGRIDSRTGTLAPYLTRGEIREAGLMHGERVLLWVDDPVDAVAVEIEGSGKATLEDGTVLWVAFAGKNGRRGAGLGGVMRAVRELRETQGTRDWSDADIAQFYEITDLKESSVFFEIESRAGAIGTQDVVLTPRRSIAVDRAVISLSTPIWVDTRAPESAGGSQAAFQHLLIAQDTGGAIRGPVRGDIYFGDDRDALAMGSRVSSSGRLWLLLPRGLRVKSEK